MKSISKVILSFVCCLYCFTAHSQTVRWQEKPQWDTIEMLNNQLLRVEQSGKWGVIGLDGYQIVPCDNSIITETGSLTLISLISLTTDLQFTIRKDVGDSLTNLVKSQ